MRYYTLFQLRLPIFDKGMKTSFKSRGRKVWFSDVVLAGFTKFLHLKLSTYRYKKLSILTGIEYIALLYFLGSLC